MSEAHESRDIDVRAIAWAMAVLLATIAVVGTVLYWIYPAHTPAFEPPPGAWTSSVHDAPRLQTSPPRDLAQLRRQQIGKLNSYGWVDRGGGIARIPIEQAMAILPQQRPELVIEPVPARATTEPSP